MNNHPRRALFVGAGASIALGAPGLDDLIEPIAARALEGYEDPTNSLALDLAAYLWLVHGVGQQDLRAEIAGGRPESAPVLSLPGVVELLTLLDMTIAEGGSFGHRMGEEVPDALRTVLLPTSTKGGLGGLTQDRLRSVHRAIVVAIGSILGAKITEHAERDRPRAVSAYRQLVQSFSDDAIITTNWDTIIDRLLWRVDEDRPHTWKPGDRRVVYSRIGEAVVDFQGQIVECSQSLPVTLLHKLHGSLNWLFCPRCKRLTINPCVELTKGAQTGRLSSIDSWMDRTCWCESEAEPLIVTPSFSKNYSNLQIQSIWRDALQSLATAEEWTFVGYSLPMDDFAVRALITRALAWKRSEGLELKCVRVFDWTPERYQEEAEATVASGRPPTESASEAVKGFYSVFERYRRILGKRAGSLSMCAGGVLAAAGREGLRLADVSSR